MAASNWQYLEDKSYKMGQWLSNPPPGEDVVITGIAGKFPESDDVYQFGDNLFKKVDLISEDNRRWRLNASEPSLSKGKLNDISAFDAGFFGIPSLHANNMDVCMRMILERTYEAIVDAGYHASELAGTKTGVFISSNFSDCENYILYDKHDGNSQSLLGSTCSMLAQHISYFFQFQGPSCVLDSGCSASMYALEHAYRSIRKGICDMAVVGGVNLCLHPNITMHFARAGVLSPDGRCKTFDNSANGYVRSEAIVAVLLQKSKDARRIYARILHTKLNVDGYKQQGIGHPSSEIQAELMRKTYAECNVDLSDVNIIEAHGTGTIVGDLQELNAIADVFCSERDGPLYIGAVKSNAGHTEPVAALVSIIKVLLAMERGFIPPNINYSKPREGVDALVKGFLKVMTEKTAWPNSKGIAGVNSLGIGGANGHAVLRRNGKQKTNSGTPEDNLSRLVCASGRTKEALNAIWDDVGSRPLDAEFVCLLHKVFEKRTLDHPFRGYQILGKVGELKRSVNAASGDKRKLAWVFSNFDSNWPKVGKELVAFPVFAEALKKVQSVMVGDVNVHIIEILEATNQVLGTMATQICLASALRAVGLIPDTIIGLGTGELIVAYLEDHLTLDELCAHFFGDNVNPSVCREYFAREGVAPLGFAEVKKLLLSNCDVLVIGGQIEHYEHLSLIREDSRDYVLDLLTTLGRFYEKGHDLCLNNLYPEVTWPVSRGTPMISPLIKWNYGRRWRVPYQGDELRTGSRQRAVQIDVKTKDWNFITGHVIDGRNIFPATGLLYLAWETLADMNDKTISEMKVVFENVRFVQAVNLTNQDVVQLTVSVLDGSKTFEISERGALIMKGAMYEVPDTRQERAANLPQPPVEDLEGNVSLKKAEIYEAESTEDIVDISDFVVENSEAVNTLSQSEIYKEMRIRGYNYKGSFKGLTECSVDASRGLLTWTGNWISFMDSMLQITILQMDTKNLYIPTSLKQVVIDAPKHMKLVSKLGEKETIVPLLANQKLEIIKSGAIEFRGLKASSIPRRKKGIPVLETYKFVPNDTALPLVQSVRVLMQMILENNPAIKVKSVELPGDSDLLSPLINQALGDLTFVQAETIVLSSDTNLDLTNVTVEDKKLGAQANGLVVVVQNAFGNDEVIDAALDAVKDTNGYVIAREIIGFDVSTIKREDLDVVCVHRTDQECLVLLRKLTKYKKSKVVDVSNEFDWISDVQGALKEGQKLILYSQNVCTPGILGLVNCLRRESNGSNVSCFYIVDDAPKFDPDHHFYARQVQKNLAINIWKGGRWGAYRHLPLGDNSVTQCEHCYANVTVRGDLSSMKYIEGYFHKNHEPEPGNTFVYVYYATLNFRDVMIATGRISIEAVTKNRAMQECVQGSEFAGRDMTGKRVMGITCSALATHVQADSLSVWAIPDEWSMEEAATIPVVYSTVIYALLMRARMTRGQNILIHSATGGIGHAAINIALHFGCDIFVTVGTQEKREYLRRTYPQIKDSHIGNSHDTSFEQMIYSETKGRGVDLVLNSLAEEKLLASVRCVARGGHFLEIGKFDVVNDNSLETTLFERGATFHGIMLDTVYMARADIRCSLRNYVGELICQGAVKPLSRTVFQKEEIVGAFRFMAAGKHMGKVLVKMREEKSENVNSIKHEVFDAYPRYYCDPNGTYIILGGLGGFALELADWLIMRRAGKLILTSRTGVKTGYQTMKLRLWQSYGVEVIVRTDDMTTKEGCMELIKYANTLGPVKGVFNLAVVLKDALFENQSLENFTISFAPKAVATQHLDTITREMCPELREFVVFSSISCGRGNPGQTNYAMANSIMERICEQRKAQGYPALAIQWGAVGDVGLVAEMNDNDSELAVGGTLQQGITSCLQTLDTFLKQDEVIVGSMVVAEKSASSGANNIIDAVLNTLGISDVKKISLHTTFPELGMDSMMGIEIKQTLEREYEVFLSAQDIRTMTFARLQEIAKGKLSIQETSVDVPNEEELISEDIKQILYHISDEKSSYEPFIEMGDYAQENGFDKIYVLPGIEGTATAVAPLIENLKKKVVCLQYCPNDNFSTLEDLAISLLPYIDAKSKRFILVAHSFGCVLATELVHLLEMDGRIGTLVYIDGSPEIMANVVKNYFDVNDDDAFETGVVCAYMSKYLPSHIIMKYKQEMLRCKSMQDRIKYGLSMSPNLNMFSKYLTDVSVQGYFRIKAVVNYVPNYPKLRSKVRLIRPKKSSLLASGDVDYGLSTLFHDVVNVVTFEGDHLSILKDPEVAEAIRNFIG